MRSESFYENEAAEASKALKGADNQAARPPAGQGGGQMAAGGQVVAVGGLLAAPVTAAYPGSNGAAHGGLAGTLPLADSGKPMGDDAYWETNYVSRPYVDRGAPYAEYQPAYRYGWECAAHYSRETFDQAENAMERGWANRCGSSSMTWLRAKQAVRDAWERVVAHRDASPHERPSSGA